MAAKKNAPGIPKYPRKFQVVKYIEVVQNADGMWVINKMEPQDLYLETEDVDSLTVKEVCSFLKDHGIVSDLRKVSAVIGRDLIEVSEKKTMKPICRLQKSIT